MFTHRLCDNFIFRNSVYMLRTKKWSAGTLLGLRIADYRARGHGISRSRRVGRPWIAFASAVPVAVDLRAYGFGLKCGELHIGTPLLS